MCRVAATISPPGIFFGPSSATLENFQFVPSPVELPLCSSYSTLKAFPEKKPDGKHKARPSGLQFVSGVNGVTFKDETFVREVTSKVELLKREAADCNVSNINALLAKKALKYRRIGCQVQT
ncbi:hypothetical protein V7S43_011028 [Phytophthora oleae]|uniref:Uncharacterized protein n=1 Tax=Phytophthora oleae TaxID=2107226 RepID=A0ABD3FCI2_9STRA